MNATITSLASLSAVCVFATALAQTPSAPAGQKPPAQPAPQTTPAPRPAPAAAAGATLAQLHLLVSDVEAQKKLWEGLGATAGKIGSAEVVRFPNIVIVLEPSKPKGGTKGSVVDHVALDVPDVKALVTKLKAAKVSLVTRAEVNTLYQVADDVAFLPDQATSVAVIDAPDGLEVELVENKQAAGAAFRHVHFAAPQVGPMKEWYIKNLGAVLGNRGFGFEALDVPKLRGGLTFTLANDKVEGTDGRVLDHIGFEVRGLAAATKRLERAGAKVVRGPGKEPASGVPSAVVIDPWGTKIELTEGLK